MRYFWIILSVILLPLVTSAGLYGQTNFSLKGVIVDTLKNEPVEFATISLIPKGETTALKYALTNSNGGFEILSIPGGVYNMRVEYLGYKAVTREVNFSRQRAVDVGKIGMIEDVSAFEAVTVSAMGNPITVKKDTIEFNAASFKTTENDALEDLLKKLPGIEVDSDGNITANGKTITKIMVDGKAFFLNDPQLATKNLPAKIVDKVRVVDRRSEQAQFTGIDDGNDETVIDLSIRPGMMNGWFGNMTGGYGTEDRYQAAGTAGRFSSSSQLMFIGNANNTNNRAFSDMAGSMMRGAGGGAGMAGGNVRIGGALMSLGGSGITTSWMLGANGSYETDNRKLRVGGSYSFGSSDNVSEGIGTRRTFLEDSTFVYDQSTKNINSSDNHSASFELDWKLSDKTSILFRPRVSITKGVSEGISDYNTTGFIGGADLSGGDSRTYLTNDGQNLSGDLLFRQRLNKPGRTFSVNLTYSYSNSDSNGHNESETYINDQTTGLSETNIIDQKYNTLDKSYSMGARASYTEALGGNFFLELAYRYNYSKSQSTKEAFNHNGITNAWDIRDDDYSTDFTNTFITQQAEVNLRKNGEKLSYTVGMNAMPSRTKSVGGVQDIDRSVVNFSPIARIEYRFSDVNNLRINYRGSTRQPTISQLQPVPDNSNPLRIPVGNPDLLPSFTQNLSLEYRSTNRATFRSMSASIGGNYVINSIVNKTWYEDGGVQYSQPVNEDGVYSLDGRFMYNTPIAKSKFYVMNNTSVDYNNGISYSNALRNETQTLSVSEMLNLTYRGTKVEVRVGGRARYYKSWYSINTNAKSATWNNSAEASFNWTLPAGINLESNFNYIFYVGYGTGYNEPSAVWNASATKLLFKNMGTLSVRIFDILKEARSVNMSQTDNYFQETRNIILGQYVMVSFTYRFGTFGGNRARGGDRVNPSGERPMGNPGMIMMRR